jgi:hypothetical protein
VLTQTDTQRPGEARGREIVVGRPQATAHQEQIGLRGQREPERRLEEVLVVGHDEQAGYLHSPSTQIGGEEPAVGVLGAPVEELVAAEHDGGGRQSFDGHSWSPFDGRWGVPGSRMTPRALRK